MENLQDILRVQGVKAKGFGIIPKLVMQDPRLSRDAKAIYAYFCSFAGSGETAFPSVKRICKDLGFKSEDTYRKHFKLLVKHDFIRVKQQKKGGKFAGNIYTLVDKPELVEENSTDPENLGYGEDTTDTQFFRDGKKPGTVNSGTNNNNINKNNSINNIKYIKSVRPSIDIVSIQKPEEIETLKQQADRQTDSIENIIKNLVNQYSLEVVKRSLAKIRSMEEKTGKTVGKKGFAKYLEKVCEEQAEILLAIGDEMYKYPENGGSDRRIGENVYRKIRDLDYLLE